MLLKRSSLKEVLGFEGRGAQVRFAERIGVPRRRLNNVLVGYPLSRQLAQIIIRRYPHSSTDFLLLGRSGGNLDRNLKQQLLKPSKENWDFSPLIPNPIDQNPWAHWRSPMDMMRQGWSTSLFHAAQQWSTRSS